jgi:hypothetical protein
MKHDPGNFPERQQRVLEIAFAKTFVRVKGLAQTINTRQGIANGLRGTSRRAIACDVLEAHRVLMRAFKTDVTKLLEHLREEMGVPTDPIRTHRQSGYTNRNTATRGTSSASGGFPT